MKYSRRTNRFLIAITLMVVISATAYSQRTDEILETTGIDYWRSLSYDEQSAFMRGWILAQHALWTEFSRVPDVYDMMEPYVVDPEETPDWMISHVREIYEYARMRSIPLGVVVQLRHAYIQRLREGNR